MFLHAHGLPQLVPPAAYASVAVLERERRRLFAPAWHYVGLASASARDGDFFTTTLFDHQLILWRAEGRVRCFLNVCPHRFAEVTAATRGRADLLRCPYHGWEFAPDGRSKKIPEAGLLRPLNDVPTGLREFSAVERHGLLFVNLSNDASVEQYHTPAALDAAFPPGLRHVHRWSYPVAANWKLVVENAVESYHVASVHTATFKVSPRAEDCQHQFEDAGTGFRTGEPPADRWQRLADRWVYPVMGLTQDRGYRHDLIYPNLMVGRAGLFSWVTTVTPEASDRSRIVMDFFMQRPRRQNPLAWATAAIFRRAAVRFTDTAAREDAGILPRVQRGIASPVLPSDGVLSAREERIHHFQSWWLSAMGDDAATPDWPVSDSLSPMPAGACGGSCQTG